MAENSHFRKIVDPIKQLAISISKDVLEIARAIVYALLSFIFPPAILKVWDDWDERDERDDWDAWDETDDFWFDLSSILYMFLDALFLYVPVINGDTKCVMLDNRLKIAAIVLRSFGDFKYVLRIYLRIKDGQLKSLKKIAMSVANVTVCILPVPQVAILIFLPKIRGSKSLKIMKFLNSLVILQYLPRLYPILKMCKQVNKDMLDSLKKRISKEMQDNRREILDVPKWFGIAINIVGYILASHVLGAFWYYFSIQREIDCWGYACRIENGCEFSTSCVENTFRNITHIKNLCPVNPPDAAVFDFGIFLYALQSGIQESTNFLEKLMQCFSWGLRNLSSFASNLNSSTYGWENVFVVVISICGLVSFMYLLGHSQTYMQEADRRENVERKMKMIIKSKIQSLLSEYGLPKNSDMKSTLEDTIKLILEKDEDFIVENMFSILSFNFSDERQDDKKYLDFEIKRGLFLGKLEKVNGLKDKEKKMLEKICEHLEPMIYVEGSYIIQEGEPLDMMFFVTQGIVLTYATNNGGSSSSGTIQLINKEKDSLYGEELLTLTKGPSSELSTLPISPITVKSHKKVEVFALKAVDLQSVVSQFPSHFNTGHTEIVSA